MFGTAVERALRAVVHAHEGQFRKGEDAVPYVTHPLHVAIILARWGFEEDLIVAGLMHDAVEDSEVWTLDRVEFEFGPHVASIVEQLTEDKSKSWEERKRWAIDHVPRMSPEAASVKAADKLHNLQTLLHDLRVTDDREALWSRFKGGKERTLALDRELVDALCERIDPKLCRALRAAFEAVVDEADTDAVGTADAVPTG